MKYRVIAYFCGADGSLGYRHGKSYELLVEEFGFFGRLCTGWALMISRIDGTGQCPYRSFGTFLENWKLEYKIL